MQISPDAVVIDPPRLGTHIGMFGRDVTPNTPLSYAVPSERVQTTFSRPQIDRG